jgi:hypothetical protein
MNSTTHTDKCRMGDTANSDSRTFRKHLYRIEIVTARSRSALALKSQRGNYTGRSAKSNSAPKHGVESEVFSCGYVVSGTAALQLPFRPSDLDGSSI